MPKKPTNSRLDKLFDDINDESATPVQKPGKRDSGRLNDKKVPPRASRAGSKSARASAALPASGFSPTEPLTATQTGSDNAPATMSLAFQMDNQSWATLQVVDERAPRAWDQNDQLLIKQVTDQLSQALENARLFQETRSRAEELAILNEMGRELTTQLEVEQIVDTVYRYTGRLMDTTNLFISLYNESRQEITPIFVMNHNERIQVPSRKLGNELSDYILRTHEPIFFPEDVAGRMRQIGLDVIPLGDSKIAQCWLGAPLLVGDAAIGVIGLQSVDNPNLYNERHRDLLIAIADRAAVALENARLFREARTRAEELAALNEFTQKLSARLDVNQVLQEIYNGVARLLDATNFYIGLYNMERQEVTFPLNVSESVVDKSITTIRSDQGMTGYIIRTRAPLLIPANVSEAMQNLGIDTVGEPSKSWLGVPLMLGEQVIGVMAVQSYAQENAYNEHSRDLLLAFAGQAAISIQNARLFAEAERRTYEVSTLADIANEIAASQEVEPTLNRIAERAREFLAVNDAAIYLVQPDGQTLRAAVAQGSYSDEILSESIQLGEGITGAIAKSGRAEIINNPHLDPRTRVVTGTAPEESEIEILMVAPIVSRGRVNGTINVWRSRDAGLFNDQDLNFLVNLARQAAIALDSTSLFTEVRHRNEQLAALNEIVTTAAQSLDLTAILGDVLRKVFSALQFEAGLVTIFNEKRGKLERAVRTGLPGQPPEDPAEGLQGTLCEYVFESGQVLALNDLRNGAPVNVQDIVEAGFRGYLGIPLNSKGATIGTLCIFRRTTAPIPANTIALGQSIGNQIGFAIENARLFQEAQHRTQIERLTGEISTSFVSINPADTDKGIDKALEMLGEFTHVDRSYVFLFRSNGEIMDNSNEWCAPGISSHITNLQNVPSSTYPYLMKSLKRLGAFRASRIDDLPMEAAKEKEEFQRESIRSITCVPMILRDELIGFVGMDSVRQEHVWEDEELNLLKLVGDIFVTALNRKSTAVALEKSEADLRALFSAMTDVIIVYDKDGRYKRIAPTNPSRLFLPPSDMIGKSISEVLPFEVAKIMLAGIEKTLETGDTTQVEYPLTINDNQYWFDGTISKLSETEVFLVARDVTERRQAEQEISKFKLGIDSSTDVVFMTDINGTITYVNPAFEKVYGFKHEETLGKTPRILKSGMMRPEYYKQLWGSLLNKQTISTDEIINKTKYGNLVYVAETNSPILDERGDILGFLSVHHDITDRKRAEEDIRKFKLGIDQSSDAVFITDPAGTIVYANPGFEKIYGFSPAEAVGQNPRIIKSGLLTQENYEHFWGALTNKQTVSGEIINKAKNGRYVSIAGTNSPILDESGKILGYLAVHHDITDRKQAEEALKRRNEYLSATAEIGRLVTSTLDMPTLFSRTVNLVRDRFGFYHAGIFVTEETGFNAILQEATGEAGKEMKSRSHSLQVGSKSVVGQVTESGQPFVVNDTSQGGIHRFNPLLPETRAEAAIPLRVGSRTIGALDIQSTQPNAFSEDDIAVLQSLADQVAIAIDNARSYELSMEAVKEMREADRLKSQFLANMSHELRTPLNSIIGFSRVILKGIDGPITDLQQQDLLAIHNSGQHLLGLINDILDLSRIEAGKMELTFDEVNLPELINSVLSTVTGLIKDKPIQIVREIPADLPTVRADSMRVRQVLLNLFSNAAKFTDEGNITVRAVLTENANGHSEIMVRVTDTGPGISKEDQKKLFQPFSQVDASPTRKTGGSGLGLSISNHLIQMHGGRMGVESDSGQGSTFFFTLLTYRAKTPSASTGNPGSRVILAIDDDPQVISLYERYLQPQGYELVSLNDPARAVERVKQLKPFAITLDIMMPGYDGWHVLTDLKSNPETRDIPVIVCSIVEDQEKGFSLGAADYLLKPILEDDLLNALDRLNPDGSIREVLIVDDDPNDLRLISKILSEHGRYHPTTADSGTNGWDTIVARPPHAVILDLFMPGMDGFTILEKMRTNEKLRDIPVIVVTGGDLTPEQQAQLQEFGQRMIQKSSLTEKQLLGSLENVLKRSG